MRKKIAQVSTQKQPVGRPTAYKSEYCQQLIDHMAEGYSFESFAGKVGVSKQTIYDWKESQPEFLDATKIGIEKARLYFEEKGLQGMNGKIAYFSYPIWRLQMINRFKDEWRDKQEFESNNTNTNINSKPLSKQDILDISKALEDEC